MERKILLKAPFCGNCGRSGHLFKDCKEPVTSVGVIGYNIVNKEIKLLCVRRRHSYSYVEIVRAKYDLNNTNYLRDLIKNLTPDEQLTLMTNDFDNIWEELWTVKDTGPFVKDKELSKTNYEQNLSKIKKIIAEIEPKYANPEWGFPKGRRNLNENDFQCGVREFKEETGISDNDFEIVHELGLYEELYKANNNVNYKHIYFIAKINNDTKININKDDKYQIGEIGEIKWFKPIEIISLLRDEDLQRKKMILEIEFAIKKYNNLL